MTTPFYRRYKKTAALSHFQSRHDYISGKIANRMSCSGDEFAVKVPIDSVRECFDSYFFISHNEVAKIQIFL